MDGKNRFDPVTAVVVNWNGGQVVQQCVESLLRSRYPLLDVIVVDNASVDGSGEKVGQRFPQLQVLRNERNMGYAEGANIGIRRALQQGACYVFVLNNDLRVDPDAVDELISLLDERHEAGIAGAKIYRADDPSRLYCVWEEVRYNHVITRSVGEFEADHGQYDHPREVDCVCGAAMLIRRLVFDQIGFFDADFFAYQEQVDFCERARQRGIRIVYAPMARIWHHGEYSLRTVNALYLKTYLLRRNGVIFMKKHGNWQRWSKYLVFVFLSLAGALFRQALRGDLVGYRARVSGFWDGMRGKQMTAEKLSLLNSSLNSSD